MNVDNIRNMITNNQLNVQHGQVMTNNGDYVLLFDHRFGHRVRIIDPVVLVANDLNHAAEIKRAYDFVIRCMRGDEVSPRVDTVGDNSGSSAFSSSEADLVTEIGELSIVDSVSSDRQSRADSQNNENEFFEGSGVNITGTRRARHRTHREQPMSLYFHQDDAMAEDPSFQMDSGRSRHRNHGEQSVGLYFDEEGAVADDPSFQMDTGRSRPGNHGEQPMGFYVHAEGAVAEDPSLKMDAGRSRHRTHREQPEGFYFHEDGAVAEDSFFQRHTGENPQSSININSRSQASGSSEANVVTPDSFMREALEWAEKEKQEERFESEAREAFNAHMYSAKGRTLGDVSDISKPLGIVIPQSFSTDVKHIKVYNEAGQPDPKRTGEVRYILSDLIKHGFLRVVAGAELQYTEQTDPILLEEFADSREGEVVAYRRQEPGKVIEEYVKADDLVQALTIPTEVVSYGRERYLFRSIVNRDIVFCAETLKGKAKPGISAVEYPGDFLVTMPYVTE